MSSGLRADEPAEPKSALNDSQPHVLGEILQVVTDPVMCIARTDADNDGTDDIVLVTLNNKILALLKQESSSDSSGNKTISFIVKSVTPPAIPEPPEKTNPELAPPVREPMLVTAVVTDINNDEYDDIVFAYAGTESSPIRIFCGNSNGEYSDESEGLLPYLDIATPVLLKTADVNSDGNTDIIITSFGRAKVDRFGVRALNQKKIYVLINDGSVFVDKTAELFGEDFCNKMVVDIQAGDFNSDNVTDILILSPEGSLLYTLNDGIFTAGEFKETARPAPRMNQEMSMDVDNDGEEEIIRIQGGKAMVIAKENTSTQESGTGE